jgi:hypothetical protein
VAYRRKRRSLLFTFIAALPVTLGAGVVETSEWSLAGREGKCVPLSTLAKREPEFEDIKNFFPPSSLDTRHSYLLCGMTCVNPAMETEGASNRPSVRLGNGGLGVNLNGSDLPGAISPDIVG